MSKAKEYSPKEIEQIQIIHQRYKAAFNTEEIPPLLQIKTGDRFFGSYQKALHPISKQSCQLTDWARVQGHLSDVAFDLIGIICAYQQERLNRIAGSGHLGDPIHLVLHQIKVWLCDVFAAHSKDEKAKEVILVFIQYLRALEDSQLFLPGEGHVRTMLSTLLQIKDRLEQVLEDIDRVIHSRSAREHFHALLENGQILLNNSIKYAYGIFSATTTFVECDIKSLRTPKVEEVRKSMEAGVGRCLHALLFSSVFVSVFPEDRNHSLSIKRLDEGQQILALTQEPLELQRLIDFEMQDGDFSGVIEAFRTPEALNAYRELLLIYHRWGHFMLICQRAYDLSGDGGDLLIYGLVHTALQSCIQAFDTLKAMYLKWMKQVHSLAKLHYSSIIKEVKNIQHQTTWIQHYKQSDCFYMNMWEYLSKCHEHVQALSYQYTLKTSEARYLEVQSKLMTFHNMAYVFVHGEIPEENSLPRLALQEGFKQEDNINIIEIETDSNELPEKQELIVQMDPGWQKKIEQELLSRFQALICQRPGHLLSCDVTEWLEDLQALECFPLSKEACLEVDKGLSKILSLIWNPLLAPLFLKWPYAKAHQTTYHAKWILYLLKNPDQIPDDFFRSEESNINDYSSTAWELLLSGISDYLSTVQTQSINCVHLETLSSALSLIYYCLMCPKLSHAFSEKTQHLLQIVNSLRQTVTDYRKAKTFIVTFLENVEANNIQNAYQDFSKWVNIQYEHALTGEESICLTAFKALEALVAYHCHWVGNLSESVQSFFNHVLSIKEQTFCTAWPKTTQLILEGMFHEHAGQGHSGLLGLLNLCCGIPINPRDRDGYYLATHAAAVQGHLSTLMWMKRWGADLKALAHNGSTLLHSAAVNHQPHLVDYLLQEGINLHAFTRDMQFELQDKGWTALNVAVHVGDSDMVKILLERGANPNQIQTQCLYYEPVLCTAIRAGHYQIAYELIAHDNIELDLQDSEGFSALHCAIILGQVQLVVALIEKGADFRLKTLRGESPLDIAHQKGWVEIVEILNQSYDSQKKCMLM